LTEWLVDHPKVFLAILVSILATWLVRSNVEDSRETDFTRQMESESPLASREIAALSRENRLPLHVVAALARLLIDSEDGKVPSAVSGKDAVAVLRGAMQLQRFYDFLKEEVEKPGSFKERLKKQSEEEQRNGKTAAGRGQLKSTPELTSSVVATASELYPLFLADKKAAEEAAAATMVPSGLPAAPSSFPAPPAPPPAGPASVSATKEDFMAAAQRIVSASAENPASNNPLPIFAASAGAGSSSTSGSDPAVRLFLKTREQGLIGSYALERAAFLLSKAYPTTCATKPSDDADGSSPNSSLFVPASLLHTAEIQRRVKEEEEQRPKGTSTAASQAPKDHGHKKHAGSWTHGTFLEHSLNPTHYAYEPVKEHELHRPKVDLVISEDDKAPLHPLLAFSLLGLLMGSRAEDLPVVKTSEEKKKEEEKKEGDATEEKKAASPSAAPFTPPPTPRSSDGPYPTASQRLALYLSVLREYKKKVRTVQEDRAAKKEHSAVGSNGEVTDSRANSSRTAGSNNNEAVSASARQIARALAEAPVDGSLLASKEDSPSASIFTSTF
jgi:hypothetical protein